MWKDQDQSIGGSQSRNNLVDPGGVIGRIEIAAPFLFLQARIEAFPVKVEQIDAVAAFLQRCLRGRGDACGKAVGQRMGENEENTHPRTGCPVSEVPPSPVYQRVSLRAEAAVSRCPRSSLR